MKTTLIIPAAGEGKRFKDAGYDTPKPLIKMPGGRSMIDNVLDDFFAIDKKIVIEAPDFTLFPKANVLLIGAPKRTDGPACTVLLAKKYISDEPLLIVNCDQIINDFVFSNLICFADNHDADVILGCFISTSPKNSYVRLNDDGQIIEVREKEVISNIATNGLHWFRRGSDFVRGAEKMIEADDRVNGEFYIAPSVNYLIAEGLKVMPFFFNLHFPIGTPEDLQKYKQLYAKI